MTRIAIVEDQKHVADAIGRSVGKTPGLLLSGVYYNAESALVGIPEKQPNLVLMDLGLPKMDGIKCMIRLRDEIPHLSFLVFTIYDANEKLFDALRFGADGYILKDEGISGAIAAIQELIQGGAPMSRDIARKVMNSFRKKDQQRSALEVLTPKQNEALYLIADGLYNKEIAERMGITKGTVKLHVHAVYKKLQVNNRVEAINYLREHEKG